MIIRNKISDIVRCHDLAKQLKSLFIFLFFSFLFLVGLTTQGRSVGKCHMTNVTYHCHTSGRHSVTSHDGVT